MDPTRTIQRMKKFPKKALDNARRGLRADITDLANFWIDVPELIEMDAFDVFFHHLNGDNAPIDPKTPSSPAVECAFMSLIGLTKSGSLIIADENRYTPTILKGWPGVFKWSVFFVARRDVPSTRPEVRRNTLDIVTAAWYSLSRSDAAREMMAGTKGSIEIAAKLWVEEDSSRLPPSAIGLPSASACLDGLLREDNPSFQERARKAALNLDRVVAATGGNPLNIVQLALSRLKKVINSPEISDPRMAIFLDLVGHMSIASSHPLRNGFLSCNIIGLCTKLALKVSLLLNNGGSDGLLEIMVSSFGYLRNCLESTDGFTWVVQALNAGLLTAFVDCSPYFSKLVPEDYHMILDIIRDILPRYLVYRSVINAIDGTMSKLDDPKLPHHGRIMSSVAKREWLDFHKLALERLMVTVHAAATKGKAVTCDNVKCQKIDAKNNFQKCAACGTTLYCSKQCQVTAWKEGGHKQMCQLKQRERQEGKMQTISKKDAAFFHFLSTRDARHHLPYLRRLAKREYPDKKESGLITCIDYTVVPAKYTVSLLENYERDLPATNGSSNAEARNDALIERARENPGKFVVIQSKISNGASIQLVLTVVSGSFWDDESWDDGPSNEGEFENSKDLDDPNHYKNSNVDAVDMMMTRMILNNFVEKIEGPGNRPF